MPIPSCLAFLLALKKTVFQDKTSPRKSQRVSGVSGNPLWDGLIFQNTTHWAIQPAIIFDTNFSNPEAAAVKDIFLF